METTKFRAGSTYSMHYAFKGVYSNIRKMLYLLTKFHIRDSKKLFG
jgi:hypothetical protein